MTLSQLVIASQLAAQVANIVMSKGDITQFHRYKLKEAILDLKQANILNCSARKALAMRCINFHRGLANA